VTFEGSTIVATHPLKGKSLEIGMEVLRVLSQLDEWRAADEIARLLGGLTVRATKRLLQMLDAAGLVERARSSALPAGETASTWASWGPPAAFFHFLTRQERYARAPRRVESALRRKAASEPPPSPVLRRSGAQLRLMPAVDTTPLATALLKRRTWRTFGHAALRLQDLTDLLWLTFGVQHWGETEGQGRVALKTAPSGGACHPIEAFVLVRRVEGLRPGFYHYESDRHRLTRIRAGARTATLRDCLQAQPWLGRASMLVFMCPVFARTAWRYPTPRAYRSVLIEAGHLGQTFCVLAAERGLAPFCTLGVDDAHVDRQLGLDGVEQGVVYVVGCGTAPRAGFTAGVPFPEESL
jgi:SagB-type dehydrogenase family enzyme